MLIGKRSAAQLRNPLSSNAGGAEPSPKQRTNCADRFRTVNDPTGARADCRRLPGREVPTAATLRCPFRSRTEMVSCLGAEGGRADGKVVSDAAPAHRLLALSATYGQKRECIPLQQRVENEPGGTRTAPPPLGARDAEVLLGLHRGVIGTLPTICDDPVSLGAVVRGAIPPNNTLKIRVVGVVRAPRIKVIPEA